MTGPVARGRAARLFSPDMIFDGLSLLDVIPAGRAVLPRVLNVTVAGLTLMKHRRRSKFRHLVLGFKNA